MNWIGQSFGDVFLKRKDKPAGSPSLLVKTVPVSMTVIKLNTLTARAPVRQGTCSNEIKLSNMSFPDSFMYRLVFILFF